MDEEHWFDIVNKAVFRATTRREIARCVAVLLPGLLLSGATNAVAAKKKRGKSKGKGKGNKKGKPKPKPPLSCSGGVCAQQWAGDQAQIDYCEFICRQCDGDDSREFCIVEGDPQNPAKVADCCEAGETCCGDACCESNRHCCSGKSCCAANQICCGDLCEPDPGNPDVKCCDGRVYNTSVSPNHCGGCGRRCPDEWQCCGSTCFDTTVSTTNCGSCGNECGAGEVCRDGLCQDYCPPGYKHCGSNRNCEPNWVRCCGSVACHPDFTCCVTPEGGDHCWWPNTPCPY